MRVAASGSRQPFSIKFRYSTKGNALSNHIQPTITELQTRSTEHGFYATKHCSFLLIICYEELLPRFSPWISLINPRRPPPSFIDTKICPPRPQNQARCLYRTDTHHSTKLFMAIQVMLSCLPTERKMSMCKYSHSYILIVNISRLAYVWWKLWCAIQIVLLSISNTTLNYLIALSFHHDVYEKHLFDFLLFGSVLMLQNLFLLYHWAHPADADIRWFMLWGWSMIFIVHCMSLRRFGCAFGGGYSSEGQLARNFCFY